ncbi:MAG TPA: hypothetical protein VNA20_10325 [Frankiaceae bacterium]|nr:hypothetical protein [Frankiaceae bacterium]
MRAADVFDLIDRLNDAGVVAWLDGGWAVDALLGRETRPHSDLDLAMDGATLDRAVALLTRDGFTVLRDDLPAAVAYRHPDGREVDLHPLVRTPDGGGDQAQPDGTWWHYGAPVTGTIDGRPVPCCDLDTQLRAHVGYPPRDTDRADVAALAAAFGIEPPEPYRS